MSNVVQFSSPTGMPPVKAPMKSVEAIDLLRLLLHAAAVAQDHELACSVFGRLSVALGGQMAHCPSYLQEALADMSMNDLGTYVVSNTRFNSHDGT